MCMLAALPVSRMSARCESCNCGLLSCQPAAATTDRGRRKVTASMCRRWTMCTCRGWSRRTWQIRIGEHTHLPCSMARCSGSRPAVVTMTSASPLQNIPAPWHNPRGKGTLLPSNCSVPQGIGVVDCAADRFGCTRTSKPSAILDQSASMMQVDHVCIYTMVVRMTCNSRCLKAISQVARWQGMLRH
jgi:hypothetical protein